MCTWVRLHPLTIRGLGAHLLAWLVPAGGETSGGDAGMKSGAHVLCNLNYPASTPLPRL